MRLVRSAGKVDHAIKAGKRRAIALVAMAVKLLLRENVSTALDMTVSLQRISRGGVQLRGRVNMGAQVPRRRRTP